MSRWQADAVWKSMLHYESLQRYYTFVGERLARRQRWFGRALLAASSGAAAVLLADPPIPMAQVLALTVAALAIWTHLADYSGKSARSLDLAVDLGCLATEMRALWFRLDEVEAGEVEQAWRALDARAAEATRHVSAELLGYRSLQDRAEDETYRYWTGVQVSAVAES